MSIKTYSVDEIIQYTRANSKYYGNLYKHLPSDVTLDELPLIIDIIGFVLMTIPYFFWDYDAEKQAKVMKVLQRRAEVTEKQATEDGEKVSGGFIG